MKDSWGLFERKDTKLPGCYELQSVIRGDKRGSFTKTFHEGAFAELGLRTDFKEEYHSMSVKGVLRGLHFQLPPAGHAKLVYCIEGEVMDVALDLRCDSATYGQHHICHLKAEIGNMFYLPVGLAHGFYTLSERAIMMYCVTSVYDPSHDSGVRWDSAEISWPDSQPTLSERDKMFMPLEDFKSPF